MVGLRRISLIVMIFAFARLFPFALFILILTEIHYPAYRWPGIGSHINKIKPFSPANLRCFPRRYNAVLARIVNQADFTDADLLVDLKVSTDSASPPT